MASGVLDVLFMCLNQVTLELQKFLLEDRNQMLPDIATVLGSDLEDVFVLVLVVNELHKSNGACELLVVLSSGDGKDELHVEDTQNLALSLRDITVSRHGVDRGNYKLVVIIFKRSVHDVLVEVFLGPRKTVSFDPVPAVSITPEHNV